MEFSRQNTEVDSHSLLQGIFPNQGSNPGSLIAGGFFTSWATREEPQKCAPNPTTEIPSLTTVRTLYLREVLLEVVPGFGLVACSCILPEVFKFNMGALVVGKSFEREMSWTCAHPPLPFPFSPRDIHKGHLTRFRLPNLHPKSEIRLVLVWHWVLLIPWVPGMT